MVYILADLKRSGRYIKQMVNEIEESVIITLAGFGVEHACRKDGAPGVYVPVGDTLAKIAALGIKVRNGCTYHGVALNVDMDLTPFEGINPCGYAGLQTINMVDVGARAPWDDVAQALATQIAGQCGLRLSSGSNRVIPLLLAAQRLATKCPDNLCRQPSHLRPLPIRLLRPTTRRKSKRRKPRLLVSRSR
jgi:lipoate-protein ligase B